MTVTRKREPLPIQDAATIAMSHHSKLRWIALLNPP